MVERDYARRVSKVGIGIMKFDRKWLTKSKLIIETIAVAFLVFGLSVAIIGGVSDGSMDFKQAGVLILFVCFLVLLLIISYVFYYLQKRYIKTFEKGYEKNFGK